MRSWLQLQPKKEELHEALPTASNYFSLYHVPTTIYQLQRCQFASVRLLLDLQHHTIVYSIYRMSTMYVLSVRKSKIPFDLGIARVWSTCVAQSTVLRCALVVSGMNYRTLRPFVVTRSGEAKAQTAHRGNILHADTERACAMVACIRADRASPV